MQCQYCKSGEQNGSNCEKCGAPLGKAKPEEYYRSTPEFYNGYIVYWIHNYTTDTIEAQFWLGLELVERILLSRRTISDFVPEGVDPMPFIWDLFLLAHGEKEVLEYTEKNKKYPAYFLITRRENQELERMRGLSMFELAQESRV